MIIIYVPNETDFSANGYGSLVCEAAVVTEELNGMYELELLCPATGNQKLLGYLSETYIIKADTPSGKQLFRIYAVKKLLSNKIQINARHIFYDLAFGIIGKIAGDNFTADAALQEIVASTYTPVRFRASSDISPTVIKSVEFVDTNPVAAILGENGITALFGGELCRDNFDIKLLAARGKNRGFQAHHRKNLNGLNVEINIDETATRIKPIASDDKGEPLYLPEVYIDSPNDSAYFTPMIKTLPLRDIRVGSKEFPNSGAAFSEMRARAAAFFDGGGDKPKINMKVDFILLRDTLEYRDFAPLESIFIGDSVTIIHEGLNIRAQAKCVKYTFDALVKRYIEIELGSFRKDFSSIGTNVAQISASIPNVTSDQVLTLLAMLNELDERFKAHAHTETDGTKRISYSDLVDRP